MKKFISAFIISAFSIQTHAGSINSSAGTSMLVQGVSVVANGYAMRQFITACQAGGPSAPPNCAMAAMTAAQLAALAGSLGGAARTKEASECTGSYCGGADDQGTAGTPPGRQPMTMPNIPGLPRDPAQIARQAQDGARQAAEQGYTFSDTDGSVTGPGGKKITAQDLSSPAAMKAAGFSPEAIEKTMATNAKIQKYSEDLLKKYGNLAEIDGGSGGGSKSKSGGYADKSGFDMRAYMASLNKKEVDRGVAGLEKRLGADSIGVAQDNIFEMIHRRYQKMNPTLVP